MNIELLKRARTIIEAIPDNDFNLEQIKKTLDCGTICCAAGWLAQDAGFRELGLSMRPGYFVGGDLILNGESMSYDVALATVFATTPEAAYELFCPRGGSDYDPIDVCQGVTTRQQLSDKQLWLHRVDACLAEAGRA